MDQAELRRPRFGVIGFGRFGRLAAGVLREHGETVVFDKRPVVEEAATGGVRAVEIDVAARARVVVLCVPIRARHFGLCDPTGSAQRCSSTQRA